MNAFAAGGYQSALSQVETHREAEARLLSRLNGDLVRTAQRVAEDHPGFMCALYENDRFWTQIAIDLAGDGNRLPEDLRARLISIAGFVIRHSAKVRIGAANPQPLVDINLSVIRGLSSGKGAK